MTEQTTEDEAPRRPKFYNDRISKAKLLESVKKVRVAFQERKKRKAEKKKQEESLLDSLEEELEEPAIAAAGLLFLGFVLVVALALTFHAYDIYNDGDGLLLFNDLAEMIEDVSPGS
jgi:hypothetical protein